MGKASSRVWIIRNLNFAYSVYIASCTTQQNQISDIFYNKTSIHQEISLYQTAKMRKVAGEPSRAEPKKSK